MGRTKCDRVMFLRENYVLAEKAFSQKTGHCYLSIYELNESARLLCEKAVKQHGYSKNNFPDLASRLRWVWLDMHKNTLPRKGESIFARVIIDYLKTIYHYHPTSSNHTKVEENQQYIVRSLHSLGQEQLKRKKFQNKHK